MWGEKEKEKTDGSARGEEQRQEQPQPLEMCGRAEIAAVSLSKPGLSRLF